MKIYILWIKRYINSKIKQFIIIYHFYFVKIKFFIIPLILNNEYKTIENYMKTCSYSRNFNYTKADKSKFPKISIISPVFNTGKIAIRLLRSIQYQNFNDIEIILIDDCSMDNSLELIKKYQKKDNRIIIIKNKINKGTFASRILGILKSKGNYIIMPDSDDILLENSLKYFYSFSKKHDYELLRFNLYLNYGKTFFGEITDHIESRPIYQPELSTYLFYGLGFLKQIDFNVSNKFIKREALLRALNAFPQKDLNMYMSVFEDGLLNYILYRTCKSLFFWKRFGYYYIRNNVLKKEYKKGYLHSLINCIFLYLKYVFNYSKNTKYEKDMANELFGKLIYRRRNKVKLSLINKESNFYTDIINAFNSNDFFLYKYKAFINYSKLGLLNNTIKNNNLYLEFIIH